MRGQGNYRSGICKTISVIFIADAGESARVFALLTVACDGKKGRDLRASQTFNGSRCQLPAVKLENVFLTFSAFVLASVAVLASDVARLLWPLLPSLFFFVFVKRFITNLNFILLSTFHLWPQQFADFVFEHPVHLNCIG